MDPVDYKKIFEKIPPKYLKNSNDKGKDTISFAFYLWPDFRFKHIEEELWNALKKY